MFIIYVHICDDLLIIHCDTKNNHGDKKIIQISEMKHLFLIMNQIVSTMTSYACTIAEHSTNSIHMSGLKTREVFFHA